MNNAEKRSLDHAVALIAKIAEGKSYDEMRSVYLQHIEAGILNLSKIPHQNTQSRWMNDSALTPILKEALMISARPFRAMECAGIVDSSKMSQMRSAHARYVEYGDDVRDNADWMKMHVLVGAETLVCMSASFSGSRGKGTHDVNFILPLVEDGTRIFSLRYVLADKAYLSENVVGALWKLGLKAVIPIKKRIDPENMKQYYNVYKDLVEWYDHRQPDFHEVYRVRPKIEAFMSLVKRMADGYCWSRGRPRKTVDGVDCLNSEKPCVAWENETLCKLIYVNLRLIVQYEIKTGYQMNLQRDTFFPPIPAEVQLIKDDRTA